MKRRRAPQMDGGAGRLGGAAASPLALIHTNKVPNPASMRVPEGLTLHDQGLLRVWLDGYCRGAADAKSTR